MLSVFVAYSFLIAVQITRGERGQSGSTSVFGYERKSLLDDNPPPLYLYFNGRIPKKSFFFYWRQKLNQSICENILEKPEFMRGVENVTVPVGRDASLTCHITNSQVDNIEESTGAYSGGGLGAPPPWIFRI